MGCQFSVKLVYGVRCEGKDIPTEKWEDLDDCRYKEIAPYRVIDHGGYMNFNDHGCIIGGVIEDFDDYGSGADLLLINRVDGSFEHEVSLEIGQIKDLLTSLNIPFTSSGIFIMKDWS